MEGSHHEWCHTALGPSTSQASIIRVSTTSLSGELDSFSPLPWPMPPIFRWTFRHRCSVGMLAGYMWTHKSTDVVDYLDMIVSVSRLLFERMKILPLYLGASSILRTMGQCAAHNSLAFSTGLRTETPIRKPKAVQVGSLHLPMKSVAPQSRLIKYS
jgi:hypothetical protein